MANKTTLDLEISLEHMSERTANPGRRGVFCSRLTKSAKKDNDVATASLIENWIDQTERHSSFLSEVVGDHRSE